MDTIPEIIQAHQDLIQAYQDLLHSQQSTSNLIIIGLGILYTVLVAGMGLLIYFRTKGQIKELTKEIFTDEREKIIKKVKEELQKDFANLKSEYENKFIELEADLRYIYILQMKVTGGIDFVERIYFAVEGLDKCIIAKIGGGIRNFTEFILKDLEFLNKKSEFMMDYIEEIKKIVEEQLKTEHSLGHIKEIILKIPEELNREKVQILGFLKKIEEKQNR